MRSAIFSFALTLLVCLSPVSAQQSGIDSTCQVEFRGRVVCRAFELDTGPGETPAILKLVIMDRFAPEHPFLEIEELREGIQEQNAIVMNVHGRGPEYTHSYSVASVVQHGEPMTYTFYAQAHERWLILISHTGVYYLPAEEAVSIADGISSRLNDKEPSLLTALPTAEELPFAGRMTDERVYGAPSATAVAQHAEGHPVVIENVQYGASDSGPDAIDYSYTLRNMTGDVQKVVLEWTCLDATGGVVKSNKVFLPSVQSYEVLNASGTLRNVPGCVKYEVTVKD